VPPNLHRPASLLLAGVVLVAALFGAATYAHDREPLSAALCSLVAACAVVALRELGSPP
jgi:hypothetical protein